MTLWPRFGRTAGRLTALCCLAYFSSYLTRLNYGAALAEIITDLSITKEVASLAVTGNFITYGAGQLFSGVLGDRISPRRIIAFGLAATSLVNGAVALSSSIAVMTLLWWANGFFQSMLWPPLVRIMAQHLSHEEYGAACVLVSAASSVGTVAVYLVVPACIWLASWRFSFLLAAAWGLLSVALWLRGTRPMALDASARRAPTSGGPRTQRSSLPRLLLTAGLLPVLPAIVAQGVLRNGLVTWAPTYLVENYHLSTSISILTSVLLPIFSMFSVALTQRLLTRLRNEIRTGAAVFALALAAAGALALPWQPGAVFSAFLIAVITGCMYGVNRVLSTHVPAYFGAYGCVSTMSGLLNALTYLGSALSTYGIAAVSTAWGWSATAISWVGIALFGTLLCLCSTRKWGNFTRNLQDELEKTQKIPPSR